MDARAAVVFGLLGVTATAAVAQSPPPTAKDQIAAAVLPLPQALRPGAGVRGWDAEGRTVILRPSGNGMVCMADRPGDEEFDVRCYQEDFLALIDRRWELVGGGLDPVAANERLDREIQEGPLAMPEQPTAGYRMLGPIGAYDPAGRSWTNGIARWQSVHFPYRFAAEIGLPTEPEGTMPYVMGSGTWWSHVMIDFAGGDSTESGAMHATGTFDVELTAQPSEGAGATPGRMSLAKVFHGGLEGTSQGQMLTAMTPMDGSAAYVAIEEFRGTLQGRSGTFALQHSGTMTRGAQELSVRVVPDSGSGELAGLAGSMAIEIAADGVHSYALEYTLPESP